MTINEFGLIFKGLKAAYPNHKNLDTKEAFEIWYKMLGDIDVAALTMAVSKHIATNKFPPTIAEIREAATFTPTRDWGAGWELVLYAIRNYGYYNQAQALEYIRSKDELAYTVTKRLGFEQICLSEDMSIERANFRMAYDAAAKAGKENAQLPQALKNAIEQITGRMRLEEGKKELPNGS